MTTQENKELLRRWYNEPITFAIERLKISPSKEQIEILNIIKDTNRVSIRSGHSCGKTTLVSIIAIWWLFTRPQSITMITAPTYDQVKNVDFKEINKWLLISGLDKMCDIIETRIGIKGHQKQWHIRGRSSNKAENMAGIHGKYLLYIIDEASGINPQIDDVIEGSLTEQKNKLIMIGNPTQTSGIFYDSFHKNREIYKTFHFNSENSLLVDKLYITNMAKKYGKDSDIYKVRVQGEFPKGQADAYIPLWIAEQAVHREVEIKADDEYFIGVDPARYGNDESVIYYRQGLKVFPCITFYGINTSELTGNVSKLVKDIRKKKYDKNIEIRVDETGLGSGVVDQLELLETELNISVIPVNNGATPKNESEYYNLGAEVWGEMKNMLSMIQLPDDSDTIGQITTRKYKLDPKGRIQLEKKEDMKKRGLTSPDRADALALCLTGYNDKSIVLEGYTVNTPAY